MKTTKEWLAGQLEWARMTDMPECVHHVPFDTECQKCVALKASECDVCGQRRLLTKCWPMGIETYACDECRNDRGD